MSIQIVVQRGKGFIYPPVRKSADSLRDLFENCEAQFLAQLPQAEREQGNFFYTVAHHHGANTGALPARTYETFKQQDVLPFDIDDVDVTRPLEYAAVVANMLGISTTATTVVVSGAGVHILCDLQSPITQVGYFKKNKQAYGEICTQIELGLKEAKLPYNKIDRVVFEPARVFRLPGTLNKKAGRAALPCHLIQLSDGSGLVNDDLYQLSGLEKRDSENISPQEIKRSYPLLDFKEIFQECRFVQDCVAKPEEVHEPQYFRLLGILNYQPQDVEVMVGEKSYNADGLARYVFEKAVASRSLAGSEYEDKKHQALKYGAPRCNTVNGDWGDQCKTCPHFGQITSPVVLKSANHIGSQENGFWLLNEKGKLVDLHYGDLSRFYAAQKPFMTTSSERILHYNGTHYERATPVLIKSWLHDVVKPSDPLKERHRNEFYGRVRATHVLSEEQEKIFFRETTRGKLNCANGILDLTTGQLIPHTPQMGFLQILPYDYEPGLRADFFMDWISTITQQNKDFQEMLLDIIGYLLWPNYDEHAFIYFTGEGGNGKSTFLKILGALVGEANFSSMSIKQLCTNRFAPAALEGKMFNISSEESGTSLTSEELNILKSLSSGEHLQIERKGQQGYQMLNQAKLLFSANKIPRFEETNQSIIRRLIVVPFNVVIPTSQQDVRVERRLIEEKAAILSQTVVRIQKNVARNGGVFKMHRGGESGVKAQEDFLKKHNTALSWAEEYLESSEDLPMDQYVTVGQCYAEYEAWCKDNGHKYLQTKENFSKSLNQFYIVKSAGRGHKKKIGGKDTRVFLKTRLLQGVG